jgi:serine/threonine protein kinase
LTNKPLFYDKNLSAIQIMIKISTLKEIPKFPNYISKELEEFLKKCLKINVKERSTAKALLNENFIKVEILDDNNSNNSVEIIEEKFFNGDNINSYHSTSHHNNFEKNKLNNDKIKSSYEKNNLNNGEKKSSFEKNKLNNDNINSSYEKNIKNYKKNNFEIIDIEKNIKEDEEEEKEFNSEEFEEEEDEEEDIMEEDYIEII